MPHIPVDPILVQARHRIDATFMPRVTAQDTLRRHHRSARRAMHAQRLDGVFAAAWPEAAVGADERTDRPLIDPYRANSDLGRPNLNPTCHTPVLSSARLISPCSAVNFRARVLSRPISTRSAPTTCRSASSSLAASFSRRRVRLRTTAFPTFLVTVKPSRTGSVSARARACNTTPPTAAFRPDDATRKNSGRRFRRPGFAAVQEGFRAGMNGTPAVRASGGQLLAALGAAICQNLATTHRLHAGTKSMPMLADQLRRLIGTLHDYSPKTL